MLNVSPKHSFKFKTFLMFCIEWDVVERIFKISTYHPGIRLYNNKNIPKRFHFLKRLWTTYLFKNFKWCIVLSLSSFIFLAYMAVMNSSDSLNSMMTPLRKYLSSYIGYDEKSNCQCLGNWMNFCKRMATRHNILRGRISVSSPTT